MVAKLSKMTRVGKPAPVAAVPTAKPTLVEASSQDTERRPRGRPAGTRDEEMVATSCRIPKSVYRMLKLRCLETGEDAQDVIAAALKAYLAAR